MRGGVRLDIRCGMGLSVGCGWGGARLGVERHQIKIGHEMDTASALRMGMRGDFSDGEKRTLCGCSLRVASVHSPTFPYPCSFTRSKCSGHLEPRGGGGGS